jgi:hypothetical protein
LTGEGETQKRNMAILLEDHLPVVKYNGLNTNKTVVTKGAATVPASAGAVAAGIPITLFTDGPSIYVTSDVPAFSAVKGSLCINTGGSSSSTRLYVNNGTTNWVAFTTAS